MRPAVHLVVDPSDSLELVKFAVGLQNLDYGRLVCLPLPGGTGDRWLAFDLLTALGKDPTGFGAEHVGSRAWWWAELWLRAEEVADVFVLRAHLLRAGALDRLLALQVACGFGLWLIGAGGRWRAREHLRDAGACLLEPGAFVALSRECPR